MIEAPRPDSADRLRRRLVAAAALSGTACGAARPAAADLATLASAKAHWRTPAANPILPAGSLRDKSVWNDPCVLRLDDGRLAMYMTSSVGDPFKPPILPFRAVSDDGLQWRLDPAEPVLTTAGTPYLTIETPSVVRFGGRWHLYYMGVLPPGSVPAAHIGHATSDDGLRWRHDPAGLRVVSASGNVADWNGFMVSEPGAVVVGDRAHLYFHALGARPGGKPPQLATIGLATSRDGSTFEHPRRVLQADERVFPPAHGWTGYATVSATLFDGRVHLFYGVVANPALKGSDIQQAALHHSVSDDGVGGWRGDPQPIFTRADFDWTEGGIIGPSVLIDGDRVRMWFAGHMTKLSFVRLAWNGWKGRQFGIGYAELPLSRLAR